MSQSTITITATFADSEIAKEIEAIMNDLSLADGMPLHEFLESRELAKGMQFYDSWWVPEKIKRNESVLHLQLTGSPSGYCEEEPDRDDDIVEWLRLYGVKEITGKLVIDGGGDVDVIEF